MGGWTPGSQRPASHLTTGVFRFGAFQCPSRNVYLLQYSSVLLEYFLCAVYSVHCVCCLQFTMFIACWLALGLMYSWRTSVCCLLRTLCVVWQCVLSNRLVRFLLENTLLSPCFHALSVLTRKALGVVLDDNLYSYLLLLLHYICCESSGLYIRRWYSL